MKKNLISYLKNKLFLATPEHLRIFPLIWRVEEYN